MAESMTEPSIVSLSMQIVTFDGRELGTGAPIVPVCTGIYNAYIPSSSCNMGQ